MNQRDNYTHNFFMLTSVPTELSFLQYQVDYQISGSLRYVKSFTIFMGSRKIRKYTLKKMLLVDQPLSIGHIITEVMFDGVDLNNCKDFTERDFKKTTHKTLNTEARNQAASKLFSDLGF
jgi:hypothetical protein